MSRVSFLIPTVVGLLISPELKRSFGLLGMVGFSFSVVTSSVAFTFTNCTLTNDFTAGQHYVVFSSLESPLAALRSWYLAFLQLVLSLLRLRYQWPKCVRCILSPEASIPG